jgi:osmotically-inducible protein OsmY
MESHSHRNARTTFINVLRAPTLSLAMLARVTVASAGMLGALSGCAACSTAEAARMQASDSTIAAAVKAKLAADGDLQPAEIVVTAKEGIVTLKGRVKTDLARERAERDARETDGVRRVIDLVKVGDLP